MGYISLLRAPSPGRFAGSCILEGYEINESSKDFRYLYRYIIQMNPKKEESFMYTYSFCNDYSEGAHPRLMEILAETSMVQEEGYGNDTISEQARELLQRELKNPEAHIHFVSGGTQANLIVLASLLRPFESVIAADSGHINVHETGAIEATGHKVHALPAHDGKLTADDIEDLVAHHTDEHMVHPRVVFLSNSTEVGTVYTKAELESIAAVCRKNGLYLYLDGARLASALVSPVSDLTLADLSRLVDVFYVGGTKNGALLGEAIVINTKELQPYFRYHIKQRGGLLAKGRVIGSQFVGFFTDGLYFELARHANAMAALMARGLEREGVSFLTPLQSNQIFPVLSNTRIHELQKCYGFNVWDAADAEHSSVRLVTSWATQKEHVVRFLEDFQKCRQV